MNETKGVLRLPHGEHVLAIYAIRVENDKTPECLQLAADEADRSSDLQIKTQIKTHAVLTLLHSFRIYYFTQLSHLTC